MSNSSKNKHELSTQSKNFSHYGLLAGFGLGIIAGSIANSLPLFISLGALAGVALDEYIVSK